MGYTLYNKLKDLDEKQMITTARAINHKQKKALSEIGDELRRAERQEIFDEYAGKSETVRQAILGQRTIYELAKPIIDNCKALETQYEGKRFGYISKRKILGEDSRDLYEVPERLKEEGIINPKKFFSSQIILSEGVRNKVERLDKYINNNHVKTILSMFAVSGIPGAIAFYNPLVNMSSALEEKGVSTIVAFFGTHLSLTACLFLLDKLGKSWLNYLAKQRESFETALHYLDDTLRQASYAAVSGSNVPIKEPNVLERLLT